METHTFFLYLLIILISARLFAERGRMSGIFNNEIYAAMVLVIALTTLLPPFIMKWFYGRYGNQMGGLAESRNP